MRSKWMAVLASGCLAALVGGSWGALTPGQKAGAEALIKDLSNPEFKLRDAAVEKLVALGPDVAELIRPLLGSPDAEVKMRAEMILKRVGETKGETAAAETFDRDKGSLITLKVANAELSKVLEEIARQSGNRAMAVQEDWKGEKPVTVNWDKTPYWKAVDEVCQQEGLVYQLGWRNQNMELMLVPSEKSSGPTSYAGPVVFKIASASKDRLYWGNTGADILTYEVMAYWEDRLNPGFGGTATVEKMTDEKGGELKAEATNAYGGFGTFSRRGMMMMARGGAGNNPQSSAPVVTQFEVTVAPYPETLTKLGELSGKLTFGYGTGKQEVVIDDPVGEGEKSGKTGDYELKVQNVQRRQGFVNTMGTLMRDGKVQETMNFGEEPYGIWLVDAEGKRYPGMMMPMSGMGVRFGGGGSDSNNGGNERKCGRAAGGPGGPASDLLPGDSAGGRDHDAGSCVTGEGNGADISLQVHGGCGAVRVRA